jgi:hypothetical protein
VTSSKNKKDAYKRWFKLRRVEIRKYHVTSFKLEALLCASLYSAPLLLMGLLHACGSHNLPCYVY